MDSAPPNFLSKVSAALLGLLTTAFIAWAGVIWSAWEDVSDTLFEIHSAVEVTAVELKNLAKQVERHESRPWHDEAGAMHSQARREMDVMRQRLNQVESKQNER